MKYTDDLGCRFWGIPHNIRVIKDTKEAKWELCMICSKKWRWNKGYKGRIENKEYLKVHVRNFAQKFGATKRIYNKIYKPKNCIIYL